VHPRAADAPLSPFFEGNAMKKFLMLTTLTLAMASCLTAQAAGEKAHKVSKMGQCHKDAKAKNLTGDDRRAFMKECLSAKNAASEPAQAETQQDKMKACNAEAKGLKGDERKEKMSACLKG
jgi:hypothetical protein